MPAVILARSLGLVAVAGAPSPSLDGVPVQITDIVVRALTDIVVRAPDDIVFAAEVAMTCRGATARRTTRWCRWYRTHEALLGSFRLCLHFLSF